MLPLTRLRRRQRRRCPSKHLAERGPKIMWVVFIRNGALLRLMELNFDEGKKRLIVVRDFYSAQREVA
jgi:hypothetical protein